MVDLRWCFFFSFILSVYSCGMEPVHWCIRSLRGFPGARCGVSQGLWKLCAKTSSKQLDDCMLTVQLQMELWVRSPNCSFNKYERTPYSTKADLEVVCGPSLHDHCSTVCFDSVFPQQKLQNNKTEQYMEMQRNCGFLNRNKADPVAKLFSCFVTTRQWNVTESSWICN